MKIKWTNTYSHESGYVKYIVYQKRYFVNTFDVNEAKQFVSVESAKKAINTLIEYGEGDLNVFEIV